MVQPMMPPATVLMMTVMVLLTRIMQHRPPRAVRAPVPRPARLAAKATLRLTCEQRALVLPMMPPVTSLTP